MKIFNDHRKILIKKIIGTADLKDEMSFDNHAKDNDQFLEEYNFLKEIWNESSNIELFDSIDLDADWKKTQKKSPVQIPVKHKRLGSTNYFVRIAAVLVLLIGLTVVFTKVFRSSLTIDQNDGYVTVQAEQAVKEFLLPDGCSVTLNRDSRLTFSSDFGKVNREVILEGEALFDVLPDKSVPFKVYVAESVIEVTGTSFTISEEKDGKVRVSVMTGTVLLSNVENQDKKISVSANHSAYATEDEEISVDNKIPVNNLSWKTGHLMFEETPIDSALYDIARHFNRELSLSFNIKEKITAEFQDQPLNEILSELELVAALEFDTTGTMLIVSK